jgi:type VI secretion system protein ImpJ
MMKSLSRVVWSEGMHLSQHHFQAQNRYFEDLGAFVASQLFFEPHGFVELEMDAEALLNGVVALSHARGLMPDGLVFGFPEDAVPEPLAIGDLFSPTQDSHIAYLAIPRLQEGKANCGNGASPAGPVRYSAASRPVTDEAVGRDEKTVDFARKNFRLVLDVQMTEDLVGLPLARVRRDGSGRFVYDAEYVPPVVRIGASPALMRSLGRLVEILDAKADTLRLERQASQGSLAEYAAREVAGFWLSHAIHAGLGPLRHHLETRSCHPEVLYREIARLAGALCTFSLQSHPRDLPGYDHQALENTFGLLERHVRAHLDVILPENCVVISLQPAEPYFYTGKVLDRRCLERGHWFLGIRSSASAGEVAAAVPRLVKVCSAEHIGKLVARAYPGLDLDHVSAPPSAISPRIGTQYFQVARSGPCWQLMLQSNDVGIYIPAAIPDVEVDLSVVIEG